MRYDIKPSSAITKIMATQIIFLLVKRVADFCSDGVLRVFMLVGVSTGKFAGMLSLKYAKS